MTRIIVDTDDQDRWEAARKRAAWELGDPSWASIIVQAFLYPVEDAQTLEAEQNIIY